MEFWAVLNDPALNSIVSCFATTAAFTAVTTASFSVMALSCSVMLPRSIFWSGSFILMLRLTSSIPVMVASRRYLPGFMSFKEKLPLSPAIWYPFLTVSGRATSCMAVPGRGSPSASVMRPLISAAQADAPIRGMHTHGRSRIVFIS